MRYLFLLSLIWTLATVLGCGTSSGPVTANAPSLPPDPRYALAEEPADAKSVIEVRKAAKDGDEVTITGRIGGDVDPWVKGRAAFLIADHSLVACSEREGDTCPTPWDFCCESGIAESKATIKIVDEAGETVPTDARTLLNVKELQTVVIRGQAKRDEAGNLTVLAKRVYVKR
ncbi:MAG: hypothetical protein L0211_20640 [Planctomycetaceae bacterium]|nr:hypothetical protein [Planctomycetaceae bacterium]